MRKVLIVSSDDFILYQPTILNLYDFLKSDFEMTILTFEPEYLGKRKDTTRNIVYLQLPSLKRKIFRFTELSVNFFLKRIDKYFFRCKWRLELTRGLKSSLIENEVKKQQADEVIAVDLMPLCAAQQNGTAHFLSLELPVHDAYLEKIDLQKIKSVIIQNDDRFRFLFGDAPLKKFLIQNAPQHKFKREYYGERNGLIWAGSILERFGVLDCAEFIQQYPQYSLVFKGAGEQQAIDLLKTKYEKLFAEHKLRIDDAYMEVAEFIQYISKFKAGFCFYSWDLIHTNFNYRTAPSGKLFMYLAAGTPPIACNIPGFKFIEEAQAGILVDDYKPETLYKAYKTIEDNFEFYQKNCYALFDKINFDTGAAEFKTFLIQQ